MKNTSPDTHNVSIKQKTNKNKMIVCTTVFKS